MKMEEVQSLLKICLKMGPKNALEQKNKKFHVGSNFYDPVEKCKKWTKWTPLHRKYATQ